MRYIPSKNQCLFGVKNSGRQFTELNIFTLYSKTFAARLQYLCQGLCLSLCVCLYMAVGSTLVSAQEDAQEEEYLRPLPLQELEVGELFTLGIRPRQQAAGSSANDGLDLYAEGLSAGASFRRVGQAIWEFAWVPRESDRGLHVVRVLVAERGNIEEVLEEEEITLVVGDVTPAPLASVELGSDAILTESAAIDQASIEEPLDELIEEPFDEPFDSSAGSVAQISVEDELGVQNDSVTKAERPKPTWSLAPVSSHVVSPYRWVRFPVELISDADDIDEYVLLHIDRLPRGASFSPGAGGAQQFQWRPGGGDIGEHKFRFTAVDKYDANRRENVTMRIIVQ